LNPLFVSGNAAKVGALANFQFNHMKIDLVLRLGLPVAAILAWRSGSRVLAAGALAGAAVLWGNRQYGWNL
jgi:hypothetical protein